jgi:hypothetical protein
VSEFLIIGPSRAGKTALLATVDHAAMDPETSYDGLHVRIFAPNPAMAKLSETTRKTVRDGRLPVSANVALERFSFTLEVRSRRLPVSFLPQKKSTAQFTLWDGPGGSLFPIAEERGRDFDETAHNSFREELVTALKSAEGIVLCLDSTDESRSLVMFESLPTIFGATGLSDLPAKRVCICLTKVDAKFGDKNEGAQAAAERASARECCEELLPRANFGVLRNYCPDAQIAFGWTSVYGFLPSGLPNYDPKEDKLQRRYVPGERPSKPEDDWRPFRVLDPFVWLAGGHARDLEVVSARKLF